MTGNIKVLNWLRVALLVNVLAIWPCAALNEHPDSQPIFKNTNGRSLEHVYSANPFVAVNGQPASQPIFTNANEPSVEHVYSVHPFAGLKAQPIFENDKGGIGAQVYGVNASPLKIEPVVQPIFENDIGGIVEHVYSVNTSSPKAQAASQPSFGNDKGGIVEHVYSVNASRKAQPASQPMLDNENGGIVEHVYGVGPSSLNPGSQPIFESDNGRIVEHVFSINPYALTAQPASPPIMGNDNGRIVEDVFSVELFADESPAPQTVTPVLEIGSPLYRTLSDAPLGYAGSSGILPRDVQTDNHFVPVEDRWRVGFPAWDRYGKGHPINDDYPYVPGSRWDPFNQNVLKGDYPILGQNTFLEVTGTTQAFFEPRQVPTATTPFESTVRPNSKDFFGNPNQFFYAQNFFLSLDLFHGDASFRPVDWRVKITPAVNVNYLAVNELAVVSPDVTKGTTRARSFVTMQEGFVESKLADLGPDYDFVSARAGLQPFNSDFRGFIFSDVNNAVRLFGTQLSNQVQFNVLYFQLLEKDTNSFLNSFHNRHQGVAIANMYIQDSLFPGYTTQFSVHHNHDDATFKFDNNGFLARPDGVGVFQPHSVDVTYLGWTGDGHINRFNINHAFYWALGYDSKNPLANQAQYINAQMVALELSYDQDWVRFRSSFFWASGDRDINNKHATGFDTILDNPNFAGGDFSYWQRQQIRLFGVNLTQRMSLVPDLRSSKFQGQANFVNPGLYLGNFGMDFELTPKLRLITNANVLRFDSIEPLQQFLYQQHVSHFIGTDLSLGVEYRPLLNNNIILRSGVSTLIPGQGFRDLFNRFDQDANALVAGFVDAVLTF